MPSFGICQRPLVGSNTSSWCDNDSVEVADFDLWWRLAEARKLPGVRSRESTGSTVAKLKVHGLFLALQCAARALTGNTSSWTTSDSAIETKG